MAELTPVIKKGSMNILWVLLCCVLLQGVNGDMLRVPPKEHTQPLSESLINSSAIEVDLSYMHNLIETISAGMFFAASACEILNLSYNSIHSIEADAFQGLTSLTELRLDHALSKNFSTIDPAIWNGLDSITDLHLESAQGIRTIPTGAFSTIGGTLQSLYLDNIQITSVQSEAFRDCQNLTTISLLGTSITNITSRAFSGLTLMTTIVLYNMGIENIEPNAFDGMTSLTELDLDNNQLTTIHTGTFSGLQSLQTLKLKWNLIESIEFRAFDGCVSVRTLYLDGNPLKYIVPGSFRGLLSLNTLSLGKRSFASIQPEVVAVFVTPSRSTHSTTVHATDATASEMSNENVETAKTSTFVTECCINPSATTETADARTTKMLSGNEEEVTATTTHVITQSSINPSTPVNTVDATLSPTRTTPPTARRFQGSLRITNKECFRDYQDINSQKSQEFIAEFRQTFGHYLVLRYGSSFGSISVNVLSCGMVEIRFEAVFDENFDVSVSKVESNLAVFLDQNSGAFGSYTIDSKSVRFSESTNNTDSNDDDRGEHLNAHLKWFPPFMICLSTFFLAKCITYALIRHGYQKRAEQIHILARHHHRRTKSSAHSRHKEQTYWSPRWIHVKPLRRADHYMGCVHRKRNYSAPPFSNKHKCAWKPNILNVFGMRSLINGLFKNQISICEAVK